MDDAGVTLSGQEEREKEERVKRLTPLAKDVVLVLVKTIKATRMYLPNNPIYQKFRDELRDKFEVYFKDEELLSFMVNRFELTFLGQQVYQNPDKEDNIALMFFKDGIREFCFHRGITPEEIDGFIDILKFDVKARELDDDLVTLLWEKDFQYITYTVTDEATDEEAAEEDTLLSFEDEPEQIRLLDELRARAADAGTDARPDISGDEGPAQDAAVHGSFALDDEYEAIRGSFKPPDDLQLLTELTDIFYEILLTETEFERFEMVSDSLAKALEIFVARGDIAFATILVMKVQELMGHPRLEPAWKRKLEEIISLACSEALIKKVGEFISQGGQDAMEAAGSYLSQLDQRALGPTVGLLESIENRKARKAVCDIVMSQSGGNGKLLVPFLTNRPWYVVRNVVMVLGWVGDQETVPAIGAVFANADPKLRREVVVALASIKGKKAEEVLAEAIPDPDRTVRILAARSLLELSPEQAFDRLMALAARKDFAEREFEEKKEVYEIIGRAGGERAVQFFREQFRKKGIFKSQKRDRARACAAYGLAASGGEEAYSLLQSEIDSKSKAVRTACLDGLKRMKRRPDDG